MRVRWKARQLRLRMAAERGEPVTLSEVARETGLTLARISEIETNKTHGVQFDTLTKLARYYKVTSIADLLEFAGDEVKRTPAAVAGKLRPAVGAHPNC